MPAIFSSAIFNHAIFNTAEETTVVNGGKGDNATRRRSIYKPTGLTDRPISRPIAVQSRIEEIVADAATMHAEIAAKVAPAFVDHDASKMAEQFNVEEQRRVALIFALAESL